MRFLEDKDILNIAEKLSYIYDEPFADSSQCQVFF